MKRKSYRLQRENVHVIIQRYKNSKIEEVKTRERKQQNNESKKRTRSNHSMQEQNNCVDFNSTCIDENANFSNYSNSPQTAACLYHANSGTDKFAALEDVLLAHSKGEDVTSLPCYEQLTKEIQEELLSPEELQDRLQSFLLDQGKYCSWDDRKNLDGYLQGLPSDNIGAQHLCCGMCGIKTVQGRYGKFCDVVKLSDLPPEVELSGERLQQYEELEITPPLQLPIDDEGNIGFFPLHKLFSVYTSNDLKKKYHLHPEFVHKIKNNDNNQEEEATVLCPECLSWFHEYKNFKLKKFDAQATDKSCNPDHKKPKLDLSPPELPPNSIAAGVDFGLPSRLNLEPLTIPESHMIAKNRQYYDIVRIQNNSAFGRRSDCSRSRIRGHHIIFRQDTPLIACIALMCYQETTNREELKGLLPKSLMMELVGFDREIESIYRQAKRERVVQARPYIIYQRLAILQHIHEKYKKDPKLALANDSNFHQAFTRFKDNIKLCHDEFLNNPVLTTDEDVVNSDISFGDDVAAVRSDILNESNMPQEGDDEGNAHINMGYSYIHTPDLGKSNPMDMMDKCMKETVRAFNVDPHQDGVATDPLQSIAGNVPLNEHTDMDEILTGTFPEVFLFGKSYPKSKTLSKDQIRHLLLQFHNNAATNRELIIYLYDWTSRQEVVNNIAAKVRSGKDAMDEYYKLLWSEEFREKIKQAAQNPGGKLAREVWKTVLPFMSLSMRATCPGALHDNSSLQRALSMAKRYGPATLLLTVTPDDVNNPSSFRLACSSLDNTKFPSHVNETFYDNLQNCSVAMQEDDIKIPLNYSRRFQAATNNPVAVAEEYQAMLSNVVSHLIGVPLDFSPGDKSHSRRTWYFKSKENGSPRKKGVFGHVTAYFGATETQDRGALHFHLLIWGGITPTLLEDAAGFKSVCRDIEKALDSQYVASLPRSRHLTHLLLNRMKPDLSGRKLLPNNYKVYPGMLHVPSPIQEPNQWKDLSHYNVLRTGIHEHRDTCHKGFGVNGRLRCRGAYCQPCNPQTQPLKLELPPDSEDMNISQIIPDVSLDPIIPPPPITSRNYFKEAIPIKNNQLMVWELKRPVIVPMPQLLNQYESALHAFNHDLNDLATSDEANQNYIQQTIAKLEEGKQWCIDRINSTLGEDAHHSSIIADTESLTTNVSQWLQQFSPEHVIQMYKDLNHQLTLHNGKVVATNHAIHNATGSSTNAILLGNASQSAGSLFYIANYVCKNKVVISHTLTAMEQAINDVQEHQSVAQDSGTTRRYVQHMFSRVLNQLNKSIQISDTQMALSLLNTGIEITSDSYRHFGADYSVNFFLQQCYQDNKVYWTENEGLTDDVSLVSDADFNDEEDDDVDVMESLDSDSHSFDASSDDSTQCQIPNIKLPSIFKPNFGPAPIYTTTNKEIPPEADIQENDQITRAVHYPNHWWYRGEELKELTMVEYYAIIEVVQIRKKESSNASADTSTTRGRKKNASFRFHPNHPLYHSHKQVLRSKQHTLIFTSHPPKHPGLHPQEPDSNATDFERKEYEQSYNIWKKQADAFACYYSILFFPHELIYGDQDQISQIQSFDHYLSWDNFATTMKHMESSGRIIDKLRSKALLNYVYGLRQSSYANKQLMENFRFRTATYWTDEERQQAKKKFASEFRESTSIFDNMDKENCENEKKSANQNGVKFGSREMKDGIGEVQFESKQLNALSQLFSPNAVPSNNNTQNEESRQHEDNHIYYESSSTQIEDTCKQLEKEKFIFHRSSSEVNPRTRDLRRNRDGTFLNVEEEARQYLELRDLSTRQFIVANKVFDYFKQVRHYKAKVNRPVSFYELQNNKILPPRFIVTGDPGTGKSYLIETICELASMMKMGFVGTTSYNGIAAVNIDGNTITSMFSLHDDNTKKLNEDDCEKIQNLRNSLNSDSMCFLVVDEVSTIDCRIIAMLNSRCQQIFDNDLDFGGIPVLFTGDFNQLGPVKKTFIPKDMMTWAKRLRQLNRLHDPPPPTDQFKDQSTFTSKPTFNQGSIPSAANKSRKQMMEEAAAARFKPEHLTYHGCYLIRKFIRYHLNEQKRSEGDPKHTTFVKNLSQGKKIDLQDLLAYKSLTTEEAQSTEWKWASILVSNNRQRLNISRNKAQLWAKENNTYVYKWKTQIGLHQNAPSHQSLPAYMEKHSFFWQFFVPKAKAYLSKTINGHLALVNSAPITLHSLTFTSLEELDRVNELTTGPNKLPFGSEIEIEQPLSVNVAIDLSLDNKPVSTKRRQQLDQLMTKSLDSQQLILPIKEEMGNGYLKYHTYKYFTNDRQFPMSKISCKEIFPYDLAFSMTVHKAQGRTISRVVLDLTQYPTSYGRHSYPAVFVALSRVRTSEHIRLLHTDHNPRAPHRCYEYLTKLKPDPYSMAFYHGFKYIDDHAQIWCPSTALTFNAL